MTSRPDAQLQAVRDQPTWLVSRLAGTAKRLIRDGFGSMGANGYHYRLLAALRENGPSSQAALSTRTGIDRSDIVAAVNALVDKNVVKRAPDSTDRRRNIITITRTGKRRLAEFDDVLAEIQTEFVAPLTEAERHQFVRLLTKLVDHHTTKKP